MTGVDISGRMLEEAAKRGLYTDLLKAEALEFLAVHPARFDLIFAADVLVYFGDLAPLFAAVARSIPPGGIFAASVEINEENDFEILPSGRFAHCTRYLERLAKSNFKIRAKERAAIGLEASQPVEGLFLVLERLP
jgi:predicted TPR repeat methyltransferase